MKRQIISIAALAFIAACTGAPQYTEERASDSRNNSVDDADNNANDSINNDGAFDPLEITWCLPQAVPYDTSNVPQLPAEIDLAAFCDAESGELDGEPTHRFVYDAETRTMELDAGSLDAGSVIETTFTFDEEGRTRHVYTYGSNGFYSVSIGASWYDLDERGEMVHKIAAEIPFEGASEDQWQVLEKSQDFDAERLLTRVEHNGQDGPVVRTWSWEWSEGRLVRASLEDVSDASLTRTWAAAWTYHASGNPASVERTIDGVAVERESWTFDGEGALVSRTFWSRSPDALAEEEGGNDYEWIAIAGLDTYQRPAQTDFQADPWASALPEERGDCALLPRGPGHGYPAGEREYQLGVHKSERPLGIGFAYGNDGYGWNYGDQAWYGHTGLGASWLGSPLAAAVDELEVSVSYEGGRMVRELAEARAQGSVIEVERSRELVDGRVARDKLSAQSGDQYLERELRFTRDAQGAITLRELLADDSLVGSQRWMYDDLGHVVHHGVEPMSSIGLVSASGDWRSIFAGFGYGDAAEASWTWRYEGERLVERGGHNDLHQTMRYDDQGRMVESIGAFTINDPAEFATWTFDDKGRVVAECSSWSEGSSFCLETTFDSLGRVASRQRTNGDEPAQTTELYSYTCR